MPWLLREGDVLAAVEEQRRGWQRSLHGAVVLRGLVVVHTLTGPAARDLDVALCTPAVLDGGVEGLKVRRIKALPRRRLLPPHIGPGALVVAPAGSFERWHLQVGDHLEVRGE
jgi:hypothetical protein